MNNDNKDKKRQIHPSPDASSMETSDTEDVSKLVSSGTSSSKSGGGIDKDDIYSSDDSTRHLEKVQETEHND
jgi:hypothetical protein